MGHNELTCHTKQLNSKIYIRQELEKYFAIVLKVGSSKNFVYQ